MLTKIRFKFELYFFYLKKNLLFIIFGLIAGFLIITYQNQIKSLFTPVVKIGIEGLYTTANLPPTISDKISLGLTKINENDKTVISAIVKESTVSQDKKNYIFKIDTNATWQDGKKLTSHDIKLQIPGTSIKYPSSDSISITSDKVFSPLESLLSKPLFKNGLIGLGQYKVGEIKYQDGYVNYLRLTSSQNPPTIYRFYQNQTDLISAFKIGEVDQISLTSVPTDIESGWKVATTKNVSTNTKYTAVFLNTQKLNIKQLRQALAYATPKSTDKNDRCLSPISSTSWAYNPTVKEYGFNPTRARELFEKNKIESINLSVGDRSLLTTAENIKKNWEDILKIKVNLTVGQIDTNNFDAIIHYGSIPTDPDQYLFWHSTQTKSNVTKLNNAKIDKLLEDGRATFDTIERKRIYQDFQKALLEESPAIFLSYPTTYTVTRVK